MTDKELLKSLLKQIGDHLEAHCVPTTAEADPGPDYDEKDYRLPHHNQDADDNPFQCPICEGQCQVFE